jgi:hypothetical protein
MQLEIKIVSIWKSVTLTTLIMMTLMFSMIYFTESSWNELIYVLMTFFILFGSVIIAAMLCSKRKFISFDNGIMSIEGSRQITIEEIEWYNEGKNFLFDGIRIKTKQRGNYYFTVLTLFGKNHDFQIFKDILANKSSGYNLPEKTLHDLHAESKFLRYISTISLVLIIFVIIISFITDIKIDKVKVFYISMLVLGTFIVTRK